MTAKRQPNDRQLAAKLRAMHALAADSCDPEFNKALIEAADEIERLRAALNRAIGFIEYELPMTGEKAAAGLRAVLDNQQRVEITETENPGTEVKVIR